MNNHSQVRGQVGKGEIVGTPRFKKLRKEANQKRLRNVRSDGMKVRKREEKLKRNKGEKIKDLIGRPY